MSALLILLLLSLALNAFLSYKIHHAKKNAPHTYDARQLLHDLTVNGALIEVRRLDPERFFLRAPR